MERIIFLLLCFFIVPAHAGINGFTIHSRANCAGFNESISWDWTHPWRLTTSSEHILNGRYSHTLKDEDRWTKRSASFHATESYDIIHKPYKVTGLHWRHYTDNAFHLEGWETVSDCSIYDGWWEV